jgi:hypothetical protein
MDFQNAPCFCSGFLDSTFLSVTLGGQLALNRYVIFNLPITISVLAMAGLKLLMF